MRVVAMKPRALKDPTEIEIPRRDQNPRYVALREELAAIERRIAESEASERVGQAQARGQAPTSSIASRAKALIAGGQVKVTSPEHRIQAAREELAILHAARHEKIAALDALTGELSLGICEQFRPMAEESLRAALAAADELHLALEAGRLIRAKIAGAGYQLLEHSLPMHMFPAASVIGHSRGGATPAAQFREWLLSRGIVDG